MDASRHLLAVLVCTLGLGLVPALCTPAAAQSNARLETVADTQEYGDTALELNLYQFEGQRAYGRKASNQQPLAKRASRDVDAGQMPAVPAGTLVVACVYASRAGTLTLWSQMDDQRPVKVFPNRFTESVKGAGSIGADEEVCIGNTPEFRLRVAGVDGQVDRIYAHWAPTSGGQLGESDFPVIGKAPRASRSAASYASATVYLRVKR